MFCSEQAVLPAKTAKAFRLLPLAFLILTHARAVDQPLQFPSWLTPFPHEHDDQSASGADRLHTGYDAGTLLGVIGHYETVLHRAAEVGVTYREDGDGSGGAIFRASQNRTSCTVQIRQAATQAHVEVDCVLKPETKSVRVAAPEGPAPLTSATTRSAPPLPADALQKTIRLTVSSKGFVPADTSVNRYEALLTFGCSYQNISQRDVRAFTGAVIFQDLFGREIYKVRVTISDPIPAGQVAMWGGTVHYNQFMESQQRFRGTELQNMKVVWLPTSIIFSDGTQIGEPL